MIYRFSDRVLDPSRRALFRGRHHVELQPQIAQLLILLIENRERVVPHDELRARIWGNQSVTHGALHVLVRAARRDVGDDARRQAIIRTYARTGYRFVEDVRVLARRMSARQPSAGR